MPMRDFQIQATRFALWSATNAFLTKSFQLHHVATPLTAESLSKSFLRWQQYPLNQSLSSGGATNESALTVEALMGINANAKGDVEVLESAFIFNTAAWIFIVACFCFLMRTYPAVYKRAVEGDGGQDFLEKLSGFWPRVSFYAGWFPKVAAMEEDEIVKEAGLDGLMFVQYHVMMRWICFAITPPIVLCLIPLHLMYGMNNDEVDRLSRLGINNLPQGSPFFWVHVGYVYYVVIISVLVVLHWQNKFVFHRYKWLAKQPAPQCTTVLIQNIPFRYRSDKKLRSFFEDMFGQEAIERVYVIRRAGLLYTMDSRLHGLRDKLVSAEKSGDEKAIKDAEEQVIAHEETMDQHKDKLHSTAQEHNDKEHQDGEDELDNHAFSAAAFVTFKTKQQRRISLKEQLNEFRDQFVVSGAPHPNDVDYANLALLPHEQAQLDFIGRACILGIFFSWLPAVLTLSGLTSLQSLQEDIPFVKYLCEVEPALEAILEGILSTLALKLFMGLLPTIILIIIQQCFASTSGAAAQSHMQSEIFAFDLFFVVLVTAIGRSLFLTAKVVAKSPEAIFELLALALPASSHFYLQYVILGWFGVAFEQIRISNLLKYLAFRAVYPMAKAKEMSEPEAACTYGMGVRFAKTTIYTVILFTFCTCSPLICIFAWIYFRLASITYTYMLCKCENKKPDLGGIFWVRGLKHTFIGLIVFVTLMVGVLEERAATVKPGMIASGAFLIVYWGWSRLEAVNWETRALPVIVEEDKDAEDTKMEPVGEYVDPLLKIR